MNLLQIWLIAAFGLFILEIFIPACFFLSLAISAIIVSLISLFNISFHFQVILFCVIALLTLIFFRPFLAKNTNAKTKETLIAEQYIGQRVKTLEEISQYNGSITIYGERWEARSLNPEDVFEKNSEVKIVKNDSLIMYVEKI